MTTQNTRPAIFRKARAFTLVEILVAASLALFAVVAAGVVMIQSTKIYSADANQLMVNYDMHKFTLSLETDAAFANSFYIYDTATTGAIPTSGTADNYVTKGKSGDILLLLSTSTDTSGNTIITQIVAYYRTVTNATANSGPLYRYATANNLSVAGTTYIYALYNTYIAPNLPANAYITSVIGTASNTTGPTVKHNNLFYDLGYAIMVRSQIQEQQNSQTVLAIDTYNLTIWPRG